MKIRIISAVVASAIGIAVLFFLPPLAAGILMTAIAGIAGYELIRLVGKEVHPALTVGAVALAALSPMSVFVFPLWGIYAPMWQRIGVPVLVYLVLWTAAWLSDRKQPVKTMLYALLAPLYAAGAFLCCALLRDSVNGLFRLMLALVIAFASDTGAYFSGVLLGKHKMAPKISPKKTWEGFFGGWIVCVGITVLTVFVWGRVTGGETVLWQAAVTALIASPVSVAGDLLASLIKRKHGVKDFGTIMPGHGGVMDRFDSVCLVAPLVLLLTQWWPLLLGAF